MACVLGACLVLMGWGADVAAESGGALGERYAVRTSKPFDAVLQDAGYAIAEQNFRITGRNEIGRAIGERQGKAFPRHAVVEFCNLEYARRLLKVDAEYLLYMPCRLAISEAGGSVIIATYLLPETEPAARDVNAILKTIVQEVSR